jgi:hypothetical protein
MSVTVIETGYKVTGGIFIIPSPAFDNIGIVSETQVEKKKFCELNGIEYSDSIKWITIWAYDMDYHGNGYNDYCRHGIKLNDGIYLEQFPSYLPETILNNIEESSLLSFKAELTEVDCTKKGEPLMKSVIVDFLLTANQCKSRYARFGRFEHAVRHVIKMGYEINR